LRFREKRDILVDVIGSFALLLDSPRFSMPPPSAAQPLSGSLRIFRIAGISVFIHWSWLLVAIFMVQDRAGQYASQFWNVAEYLSLFGIVLLHEFGHALACRSVGGQANRIVLWPLGGVAFVNPPPRPGAVLWSIAAGPLVNVILLPVTWGLVMLAGSQGLADTDKDLFQFIWSLAAINTVLLIFNLLPVYPLDGGQILQALLWFVIGRAKSLLVVSVIGLVVAAVVIIFALVSQFWWYVIMAAFVAWQSWIGFQRARQLAGVDRLPRSAAAACPACGVHPPAGDYWECEKCRAPFDLFATRGVCPRCGTMYNGTNCPECHRPSPIADWFRAGERH
jgi:Zn-dependent protease